MNARNLVIAAGAATVAGALSATIAFAAEAHATAGGSGTSTTLSGGGSAFGGSAGGTLGNNGGSLVSNHGAGYRLQATAQVPVAGATVRLLDAAGTPLTDANGAPIVATIVSLLWKTRHIPDWRFFVGIGPVSPAPWWYSPPPVYAYAPPPVIVQPAPVYVAPPSPPQYWYLCQSFGTYYPQTPTCPEPWVMVPARPY